MKKYYTRFRDFVNEKVLVSDDYKKLMTNYENRSKNLKKCLKINYPSTSVVSFLAIKKIFLDNVKQEYFEWYKWHVKFLSLLKKDLYQQAQCSFIEWTRMNYAVKTYMRSMCNEDTKTLSKNFFIFLNSLDFEEKKLYLKILNVDTEEINCIIRLSTSRLNNEWYAWENKKKLSSPLQRRLHFETCNTIMNFLN